MSEEKSFLTLERVVGGIIDQEVIAFGGTTGFLVTFATNAYEDGHVAWLTQKFEEWKREIEKAGMIVESVWIKKAPKKGGKGSIEISMKILGSLKPLIKAKNEKFATNLMSTLRKTLAEIVMEYFGPKFDFGNPFFEATHIHRYVFTLLCSNQEEGKEKIVKFIEDYSDLKNLIDSCGAILKDVPCCDEMRLQLMIRWKLDATESQRYMLEKVIDAYFQGMGFTSIMWKTETV
ncbi:MAG TPA: hypothetical protein P5232_01615 [Candidatus Moranbacteria bacterium]|nr:hypothetical protein [Candidatus Moranbacteria bacterium]